MKYLWTFVNLQSRFCTLRCCVFVLFSLIAFAVGQNVSECGGQISLNKTIAISSPGYPDVTSPGVECTWEVKSPRGRSVLVQGINLSFGSLIKGECDKGRLEIFNGCGKDRFLVEQICLHRPEDDQQKILWVSSGSCVTIKFLSGKGNNNKFHLSVAEKDGSCGDILSSKHRNQIFAGSLPANPASYNKCVWIIVGVPVYNAKIELVFKDKFQVTSHGKDCKEDFVEVQDGRYSTSPTLGTFCGTSRPYPVYSTGPYLRVTLHGSRTGMNLKHSFKAQFNVIDKEPIPKTDGLCSPDGILLAPDGGTFRTPRYLEQYPPNLHCTWQIKAQENKKIVLKFREFDVEGDSQDCPDHSDYAEVYDGFASWSKVIGRYCGSVIPPAIYSKTNKLRIQFNSNNQYAGRGLYAEYSVESSGEKAQETRNHFTGIMIGTTCGIIFIVLSVLAVFHTRKLRLQREQSRRSEVASTASFDVHQANAPPSYETVMASPDLFPSNARQQSRGYSGVPHLHREISHLLGDPESDDEDLPPYPGLPCRDGVIEFCFGDPSGDGRRRNSKERHVSESEQPSCQVSAVWYRRLPSRASSSTYVHDFETASESQATTCTLERQNSKELTSPTYKRMDTSSSFVTDV